MNMKKILFIGIALLFSASLSAQKFALKNNLVYDATLTPNLAFELGLGPKTTLELGGGYQWWDYNEDPGKKFRHYLIQPELRFWSCERFNGFFWGIHLHGGEFNVAGIKLPFGAFPSLKDHRYEGYFYGAGVSIGNQWILGKRWNLEASIGAGYARYHYDKFKCGNCGEFLKDGDKNYFGVTRATLSFIYFLK